MFTLRKLELHAGKDSLIPSGYATTGDTLILFKYDDPSAKRAITSTDEVEEGYQILVTLASRYHNTSKIAKVISKEPKRVVFETQTSTYELTEI